MTVISTTPMRLTSDEMDSSNVSTAIIIPAIMATKTNADRVWNGVSSSLAGGLESRIRDHNSPVTATLPLAIATKGTTNENASDGLMIPTIMRLRGNSIVTAIPAANA